MAFQNPAAFLCHGQHSTLLFRNSATVPAIGRAFARASSSSTPEPSGPIRYVPQKDPESSRRTTQKTKKSDDLAASQPTSSNDESLKESMVFSDVEELPQF
jgi:hypothetical protein